MALDPSALPDAVTTFLTERHLATLTTLRPDGTPHVVAVGFTWDPEALIVRVITWAGSRKARNLVARKSEQHAQEKIAGFLIFKVRRLANVGAGIEQEAGHPADDPGPIGTGQGQDMQNVAHKRLACWKLRMRRQARGAQPNSMMASENQCWR